MVKSMDPSPQTPPKKVSPSTVVQPGLTQATPPAGGGVPVEPESDDRRQKIMRGLLALGGLFVVMLLIILMVKVLVKPKPVPVAQAPPPKLCYVRLAHLVCGDTDGKNMVRYDLPGLPDHAIVNLEPSPDQSQFLTYYQYPPDHGVWLLNNKLQITKKLPIPSEFQPNTVSWSRDGKFIFLELSKSGQERSIYRVNLATGELQKLTNSGVDSQPFETKDGHIIFLRLGGNSNWGDPFIMEADGSRQRPLGDITRSFNDKRGFSYDTASDTVFGHGISTDNKIQIAYGTVSSLLAGQAAQTISTGIVMQAPLFVAVKIDNNTLAVSQNGGGQIIKVSSGEKVADLPHFNNPAGLLKVDSLVGFTKSAQQTESPYERIDSLAGAPTDFQAFIKQEFDKGDGACRAANNGLSSVAGGSVEYTMRIEQVLGENFAKVSQACGDSSVIFYVKTNAVWAKTPLSIQVTPSCVDVNRYKIPKAMIGRCVNDKGDEQPNNNP